MHHLAATDQLPVTSTSRPARAPEAWAGELPRVSMASLAWHAGDRWRVLELAAVTRIGRSLNADVRFDDHVISRRHAIIVADDEGIWLSDDRSLAGTTLNGEPVKERMALQHGDVIGVGPYQLRFLEPVGQTQHASQLAALSAVA